MKKKLKITPRIIKEIKKILNSRKFKKEMEIAHKESEKLFKNKHSV